MAQLNIRTQSKIYDPNFRYDTHIEILDMDEECIDEVITCLIEKIYSLYISFHYFHYCIS